MDLSIDSDIYEPNLDETGNYIDYIPPYFKFKNGLRCPCGARKEHIFDSRQSFSGHIKTKTHCRWMMDINYNKMNYFSDNIKLKDTINNQKLIIAKLQKEMEENLQLIVHLTKKIERKEEVFETKDLLNFD